MEKISCKLAIRLFCENGKCFGPGIAELLERTEETHSLRGAAAGMGMAYSKAWRIMKETEAALGFRLISSTTGGRGGGGAQVTPEGRAMTEKFRALETRLNACAARAVCELFDETE